MRSSFMLCLVRKNKDFELNTLISRKPMKVHQSLSNQILELFEVYVPEFKYVLHTVHLNFACVLRYCRMNIIIYNSIFNCTCTVMCM